MNCSQKIKKWPLYQNPGNYPHIASESNDLS